MPELNQQQFGYRQEPLLFPNDETGTAEFRRAMIEAGTADTITQKPFNARRKRARDTRASAE